MEDLVESVTCGNVTEVKVVRSSLRTIVAVTARLGPTSAAELDAREKIEKERLDAIEERRKERERGRQIAACATARVDLYTGRRARC